RGVAVGVVGVAVIQSFLLAIGFFAIGLPGAGFWTVAALAMHRTGAGGIGDASDHRLCLCQGSNAAGYHLPGLTLVAGLSDNILTPLMLGRGIEARHRPMPGHSNPN